MADFSRPEYASYREFAREVAVERTPQDGDYYVEFCGDRKPIAKGPIAPPGWKVSTWPDVQEYGCSFYWLPTLADWLEMLEAAEVDHIAITRMVKPDGYAFTDLVDVGWVYQQYGPEGPAYPTREEAAARLYQAVKG